MATDTLERCQLCGSGLTASSRLPRTGRPITGGRIRRCSGCGAAHISPLPSGEELARLYGQQYYDDFQASHGIDGGNETVAPFLRERLATIESQTRVGRLIDLGCAMGHFVAHARTKGWEALGVETSHWAAERARSMYGVPVYEGSLQDVQIEAGSVDVIHANHVIEHIVDPRTTLKAARHLLRPGGLLVLEVPNEFDVALADRFLGRIHAAVVGIPAMTYHVWFFTKRSLALLAAQAGFVSIRVRRVRHGASTASRLPLGSVGKSLLYGIESLLDQGPNIELFAATPQAGHD